MKTLNRVSYNELDAAAVNAGYEFVDSIPGALVDSVLYCKPETENTCAVYIAGFETYLNCWSSALTVKMARTPRDVDKLLKQWDNLRAAYETETETA